MDLAQYEIFRAKVCIFWQGWYNLRDFKLNYLELNTFHLYCHNLCLLCITAYIFVRVAPNKKYICRVRRRLNVCFRPFMLSKRRINHR